MCENCEDDLTAQGIRPRETVRQYGTFVQNYLKRLGTIPVSVEFERETLRADLEGYRILQEVLADVVLVFENSAAMYPQEELEEDDPRLLAHEARMKVVKHLMAEMNYIDRHQNMAIECTHFWRRALFSE